MTRSFAMDSRWGLVPEQLSDRQLAEINMRIRRFVDRHQPEDRDFHVGVSLTEHYSGKPQSGYDAIVLVHANEVQGLLHVDVYGNGAEYWSWISPTPACGDWYDIDDYRDESCDDES